MNKVEFQNEILDRINVSYDMNKISHAYIFSGSNNSGQLEMAKYLAIKIIADDMEEKNLIESMIHPNVFYINTTKQNISKEQVLEMSNEIATSSMSGKPKIFIVDDAQKLTISAQNSLLKVVEEPDSKSIFIFIVENVNQLLTTIVSRSQIVKFKPIVFDVLYDEIVDSYDNPLKLKYALYIDNNKYDELYNSEEFTNYLGVVYDYLETYFKNKGQLIIKLEEMCYSFCNSKDKIINFVNFLIVNVSSMINYKNSTGELFDSRMNSFINEVSEKELVILLNNLFESFDMINNNVNIKLAIDKLSMERE